MFPSNGKKAFEKILRLMCKTVTSSTLIRWIYQNFNTCPYTKCTTQYSLHFIFQLLEGTSNNEGSPDTNNTIFNIDNTSHEELEVEELYETNATSSNFQLLLDSINDNSLRAAFEKQKRTKTKINA